jgi:UDP-2,4-diacetamido-2,4,6-trideoxy-beta-L-altropyranose hydrolase
MNVLIRADASREIGSGHVMRCLSLADALRESGAAVHFACREAEGDMIDYVRRRGYSCHSLDSLQAGASGREWESDARQCEVIAQSIGALDWIVVDHYGLDGRWESELRARCARLMVIDDLIDRAHACDLLLNQNLIPGAAARFRRLVPEECRLLLGPEHALLRPEFRELRLQGDEARRGPVERVLVYFGGSDTDDLTSRALALLDRITSRSFQVHALVGTANQHRHAIEARFGTRPGITVTGHTERIADLLAGCQLAIGAGGASIWERCCLGVPAVVVAIADNQIEVARTVAEAGACLYTGTSAETSDDTLLASFSLLLENDCLRASLRRAGRAMVDGAGCDRVVGEMMLPEVMLRPARLADAALVFPWRNAAETRAFSGDPRPLTLERHMEWFRDTLADPARVLLIGETRGRPVGVLRYDIDGSVADVSIYLDPAMHGRGLGPAMLLRGERWLRLQRSSVTLLRAEIRTGNTASSRAFSRAGFTEAATSMRKALAGEDANADCNRSPGEAR